MRYYFASESILVSQPQLRHSQNESPSQFPLLDQPTCYSNDRNSVGDVFFELLKDMPESPLPLHLQLDSDFLTRLVKEQPTVTLRELCDVVLRERGITISPQTLCKLLLRAGLSREVRRRLSVNQGHLAKQAA